MKLFLIFLIIGLLFLTPHQGMMGGGMAMDDMPVMCATICLWGGDAGSFLSTVVAVLVAVATAAILGTRRGTTHIGKPFFEPALWRDRGRHSDLMNCIVIRQ